MRKSRIMDNQEKETKSKLDPERNAAQPVLSGEGQTIKELSEKIGIKARDILEKLEATGHSLGVNDIIDDALAKLISREIGRDIELVSIEKEIRLRAESNPVELVSKAPVVTIMGHVDHGKTTLLDSIRESNLVGKESGGITQHIGAYRVFHENRSITFVDTPGHEAFTRLRARGAKLTDIVVLVVAADDGVMPQTREAINHAKDANVPIIVAINKIDKPEANVERVKQQLSQEGLLVEDWGGKIISIEVSAKEKTNLNEILEMILLLADVIEIKANPKVPAQGVVLEARLDPKKGAMATVIIQHGILSQGEAFICGTSYGKARALFDENGKPVKMAEPSFPVEVLGFSEVPRPGDLFQVVENVEKAKQVARYRLSLVKKAEAPRAEHLTLDELFRKMEKGKVKELPLIIKADVHGSVEVLTDILPNLSTEQIKIKIVHSATGKITESDVLLASASGAIIIGYNIRPDQKILDLAKEEGVEIRSYKVIYELSQDVKKAVTGLLEPVLKESYLGRADVRRVFHVSRVGAVAGCYVTDGKITRSAEAKIVRNKEVIFSGRIASLKHLKDSVAEVTKDYECGIRLDKFKDFQEGDIIEAFITVKEAAT